MPTLDIFNNDAFSFVAMTEAVNRMPYQPMMLGSMGLFTPQPVDTLTVAVERKDGRLSVIQTSQRGAPLATQSAVRPTIRDFRTSRLAKGDQLKASEVLNRRRFGTSDQMQTVQENIAEKQKDLLADLQLTFERHRLSALNGITLDADGSVIYNWFTEWGISQPAEITFSNAAVTAAGGMRAFLNQNIVRPMLRAAMVGEQPGLQVMALVGDSFFDWLVGHPEVKETYLNWLAAAELRAPTAFGEFTFGGVTFINYRGTDDNSTVAVAASKARFFLRGLRGLFQVAYSPGESLDAVGTLGLELYSMVVPDRDRNFFVDVEIYSYPLFFCTRPETLLRGTL
jgi:hypothetical protein